MMVAPVYVRLLLQEASRLRIDVAALCSGLGFAAGDLDVPGFVVRYKEAIEVIQRAVRAIGNPRVGLDLGMRSNLTNLGVLGLGLMASATLGEATTLALRYPRSAGFLLALDEKAAPNRQYILHADLLPGSQEVAGFLVDNLFSSIVNIRRQLVGSNFSPNEVNFVHRRPAHARAFEEFFGCPVHFGCRRNRVVSDIEWMNWPLPTANAMSYRLACELLHREAMVSFAGSSVVGKAEQAIRRALRAPPTLIELASSLNLSERTLRRRLADAGLSYRTLLDEVRKARALELIAGGDMDIPQVAAETGLDDVRSFRRAFKRWTGKSPSAAQRDRRDDPDR